jgi:hypothetical protein
MLVEENAVDNTSVADVFKCRNATTDALLSYTKGFCQSIP